MLSTYYDVKSHSLFFDNHIGIPLFWSKFSRTGRGFDRPPREALAVSFERVKPYPYEMFRMSTLGISLAICLELSARLKLVWIQGPAKFQPESGFAMFFAGVDVAKRRHELCVIDSAGDVVLNLPVENSHKGLNKILPQTPWKLKMTAPNNSDKMTLGRPKYQMVKRSCHNESISGKARDRQYRH